MDELSREYLIAFYSQNLKLLGDTPQAVRWSPDGQRMRYSLILEGLPCLEGRSILDYGCGKADLFGFLAEQGVCCHYTGMDINPDLISLARRKYPHAKFAVCDIEVDSVDDEFDMVIVCGVFNNRVEGLTESMLNSLTRLFAVTRETLVFNGLSTDAPAKEFDLHYIDKQWLVRYAREFLTPHVTLRDDYLPGDFVLYLHKQPVHLLWQDSA